MRFSTIALLTIAVGIVAASPIPDLVTEVGGTVKTVDDASGVTATEDAIDSASGGAVSALEDQLGVTYAEETIGAAKRQGDAQDIGAGVASIEKGTGITATEDFIDEESGGAVGKFEDAVGVPTLEKAIGAA